MRSGEQLSLIAMKKEFKLLAKQAEKAKKECDEYLNIGTESISIHNEFKKIVDSKEFGEHIQKKLDSLISRSNKCKRIQKKDFLKLCDKQSTLEIERDNLNFEISHLEWRIKQRAQL